MKPVPLLQQAHFHYPKVFSAIRHRLLLGIGSPVEVPAERTITLLLVKPEGARHLAVIFEL